MYRSLFFILAAKTENSGQQTLYGVHSVLALPIFPVHLQTSIFGAGELNFRVRDGNGWTLTAINTNLLFFGKEK